MGILAALAIPRLTGTRRTAAVSAHNANVRTIISAGTLYMADNNVNSFAETEIGTDALLDSYLDKTLVVPKLLQPATELGATKYKVTATDGAVSVVPGVTE